ncbi:MAG: hypothetical protein WC477_01480 [Patescibacteria group bacterium]
MKIDTHIPLTNEQLEKLALLLKRKHTDPLPEDWITTIFTVLLSVGFHPRNIEYVGENTPINCPNSSGYGSRMEKRHFRSGFLITAVEGWESPTEYFEQLATSALPMSSNTGDGEHPLRRSLDLATTLRPILLPSLTHQMGTAGYIMEVNPPGLSCLHLRDKDEVILSRHGGGCGGKISFISVEPAVLVVTCDRCHYYLEMLTDRIGAFGEVRQYLEEFIAQRALPNYCDLPFGG